jgi:hypothetical protein
MAYTPRWEPLAAALARVVASGIEESQAQRDLLAAMVDGVIRFRVTIDRVRLHDGEMVQLDPIIDPDTIDWQASRPRQKWLVGPFLGKRWESVDRIDLRTADVFKLLSTPIADKAPPPSGPKVGRKPRHELQEFVFDRMDYHGDFSDDDPSWNCRARLEKEIIDKFGLSESRARYWSKVYSLEWRASKARN